LVDALYAAQAAPSGCTYVRGWVVVIVIIVSFADHVRQGQDGFAATAHGNNDDGLPGKRVNDNGKEDCAKLKASNLGASPALEPTM
jgi:hypothetical protein